MTVQPYGDRILNVAYADDQTTMRKGLISFLTMLGGIRVVIDVLDGDQLMERLHAIEILPDVCMIDLNMPKKNGFDTIQEVRQRWPDMKILVLTGFSEDWYILRAIKLGINGYMIKNSDPEAIKAALFDIYDKGTHLNEFLTLRKIRNSKKLPNLTEKELEYLKHCCSNMTHQGIAEKLGVSARSIDGVRDRLLKKLNVNNRVMLALYAVETGIAPFDHFNPDNRLHS